MVPSTAYEGTEVRTEAAAALTLSGVTALTSDEDTASSP